MWTVFRKRIGIDEDFCFENDYDYFDDREEAENFAKELETCYADSSWDGHPYYRSKFYAWEITQEYVDQKCCQYALWKASLV